MATNINGVLILGADNGALVANSPTLKCWAENGRVQFEDTITGDHDSLNCQEAQIRLAALRAMIGTHNEPGIEGMEHGERRMLQRFCDDLHRVIAKALEQGEFGDKSAHRDREIRRPKNFSMVGTSIPQIEDARGRFRPPPTPYTSGPVPQGTTVGGSRKYRQQF